MATNSTKIVVICGPTAGGKSGLALLGAQKFNGAVVNADSVQIYRGLDIGAAKPSPMERALAPHYLFDAAAPDEDFDAARYMAMADAAIAEITARGQTPFVVGGTGFYIRALLYGLCQAPEIPVAVRQKYRALLEKHGAPYLHAALTAKDPAMAARLHANDYVRVLRALEVLEATGESLLVWQKRHGGFGSPRYNALQIGVNLAREALYARIDARVETMLKQGFEDEVRGLLARGYSPTLKALNSIGYKHMAAYLGGAYDYAEMVRLMKRDTRHYAKRQLTWFMANTGISWLNPDETQRFLDLISRFLKQ